MKFIEENKNVIAALLVACLFPLALLLLSPFIPLSPIQGIMGTATMG